MLFLFDIFFSLSFSVVCWRCHFTMLLISREIHIFILHFVKINPFKQLWLFFFSIELHFGNLLCVDSWWVFRFISLVTYEFNVSANQMRFIPTEHNTKSTKSWTNFFFVWFNNLYWHRRKNGYMSNFSKFF